jgi:hypothetical protein
VLKLQLNRLSSNKKLHLLIKFISAGFCLELVCLEVFC